MLGNSNFYFNSSANINIVNPIIIDGYIILIISIFYLFFLFYIFKFNITFEKCINA